MNKMRVLCLLLLLEMLLPGGYEISPEVTGSIVGIEFPEIRGTTLDGKKFHIPKGVSKNVALFIIAFDPGAKPFIESWHKPIFNRYAKQAAIDYFVVPMMKSWHYLFSSKIESRMKESIPSDLHKYVGLYYGSLNPYQKKLGMNDTKSTYLFVVDQKGIIRHLAQGKAEEDDLKKCFSVIDTLQAKTGDKKVA